MRPAGPIHDAGSSMLECLWQGEDVDGGRLDDALDAAAVSSRR